ncbi:IS3 family transposase [Streptomyces sp. NPDC001880]
MDSVAVAPARGPDTQGPPGLRRHLRRVTAELRDEGGQTVNHKRVARIMRAIGLQGVRLRRRRRTTVPDAAVVKAPDLTGRAFRKQRRFILAHMLRLAVRSASPTSQVNAVCRVSANSPPAEFGLTRNTWCCPRGRP